MDKDYIDMYEWIRVFSEIYGDLITNSYSLQTLSPLIQPILRYVQ